MGFLSRNETVDAPPLAKPKRGLIGEISTSWVGDLSRDFRDSIRTFRRTFWPREIVYGGTRLSYAATRSLYRNDDKKASLGAGFGRRIINSTMDFMGMPRSDTGDEIIDEFINKCIAVFWSSQLNQAIRDACRDAETVVRVRRHDPENPLVSAEEWEACYLEVVPPETAAIYYKQDGAPFEIEVAYFRHEVDQVTEQANQNGRTLSQPITRQHVIIEEVTPERYRYYDETDGRWLDELEKPNTWGFVAAVEILNEPDASIKGGQSDFESCLPFIMAFHDVLSQSLVAHKAHAIPKVKFQVRDMLQFIANNWPENFDHDENGQPILDSFSGEISWKGTEMLFIGDDEDIDLITVQSALGDSKYLLDFLLTCISISSETPKSALFNQTAQDADEMVVFAKKIERKRNFFKPYVQLIIKMVLAINHSEPVIVPLVWDDITPDIALKNAEVLEQSVMSAEVLATRQVISDATVRRHIAPYIRGMKSGSEEAADAKSNVIPAAPPTSTSAVKGTDSGNKQTTGNEN